MTEHKSVQDFLSEELMQEDASNNDMLQLLDFYRYNAVPLTDHQLAGMFLLQENGLNDLSNFIMNSRVNAVPTKKYNTLIEKLTLADRIKGNAKLAGILKANANPANGLNLEAASKRPNG
jgi:hypothetical protein